MKKQNLTDKQRMIIDNIIKNGPVMVTIHNPSVVRAHDALVKKGFLAKVPVNDDRLSGEWYQYSISIISADRLPSSGRLAASGHHCRHRSGTN